MRISIKKGLDSHCPKNPFGALEKSKKARCWDSLLNPRFGPSPGKEFYFEAWSILPGLRPPETQDAIGKQS